MNKNSLCLKGLQLYNKLPVGIKIKINIYDLVFLTIWNEIKLFSLVSVNSIDVISSTFSPTGSLPRIYNVKFKIICDSEF